MRLFLPLLFFDKCLWPFFPEPITVVVQVLDMFIHLLDLMEIFECRQHPFLLTALELHNVSTTFVCTV